MKKLIRSFVKLNSYNQKNGEKFVSRFAQRIIH